MARKADQKRGGVVARPLTEVEEAVLRSAKRRITVRQDGVSQDMTMPEILVHKVSETAFKGSPHAQRLLSDLLDRATRVQQANVAVECEHWRAYQRQERARIAAAERAGTQLPAPLPHPDDLEFDPERGVCFTGPVTEEEARTTAATIARRDLLFLQHAHDARAAAKGLGRSAATGPTSALLLANLANNSLPKRLQLSNLEMADRLMAAAGWPKRELLKALHRGWKRQGEPMPRGTVLPPVEDAGEALALLGEILAGLRARPSPRTADFDDAARELMLGARAIGQRRREKHEGNFSPSARRDG